jgi:acetyltransferase-like isoleucine patch superfamily enzyme
LGNDARYGEGIRSDLFFPEAEPKPVSYRLYGIEGARMNGGDTMKKFAVLTILILMASLTLLQGSSVNKSIVVDPGEKVERSLKTVNGSIRIGDEAIVEGDCRTVNGSITLGSHIRVDGSCDTVNGSIILGESCRVDDLETTNGRIEIGRNCEIAGNVETTNGRLHLEEGTRVGGSLTTTNGNITLQGCEVKNDLFLSNGEIRIEKKSLIRGRIEISPSRSFSSFFGFFKRSKRHQKPIELFIRDNSVVYGDIIVKNDHRKVIVYIEQGSEVKGKIINAEKRPL